MEKELEQTGKVLPDGWKWVPLEKLCNIIGGSTLPNGVNENNLDKVFCLKVSDLDSDFSDGRFLFGGLQYTTRTLAGNRILPPGSIVFPKRGGAIATNKKRILKISAILDPNLMGLDIKSDQALPSFVQFWFESWDLSSLQSGNTVPQINRQDIAPLKIPLPPLSEQQRIVAILNEKMTAIEKARTATLAQLEAINDLPAAILKQAFNGEL